LDTGARITEGGRERIGEDEQVRADVARFGVSTENGAIKPGDLLVTSSTAGFAMKGTDRERITGAIVGKALGSLDNGVGVIEVLVTLQ
jgi:hypothetical protein